MSAPRKRFVADGMTVVDLKPERILVEDNREVDAVRIVAIASSKNLAKRIANALNIYRPKFRRKESKSCEEKS